MSRKKNSSTRRQHAKVTASDVARQAGVSTMTVSRVINGDGSVRKSTRAAVEKAIKKLDYSPNKAARSLASANPIKIGMLYSNPNSTFLSSMLIGMLEQARQSDTQIVVVECSDGPDAMGTVAGLVEDGVDGIILAPPLCDSESVFRTVQKYEVPAVTVGSRHGEDHISSVFIDDFRASHAMTRHLVALGHQRIGFIVGAANQSASRLRLAGFWAALEEAGIQVPEELVIPGDFSFRSGFEAAERILKLNQAPTAILASNDDMAAGAISAAYKGNFRVPQDLSVCGFDDSLIASTVWPAITTIRQPIADMSSAAINLLEKCIRRLRMEGKYEIRRLELDFTLVQRQSDAPPGSNGAGNVVENWSSNLARRYSSGSSRKPSA